MLLVAVMALSIVIACAAPFAAFARAYGDERPRALEHLPWRASLGIAALGVVDIVLEGPGGVDAVHLFWRELVVLVCLFVAAGPALATLPSTRRDPDSASDLARAWWIPLWTLLALLALLVFVAVLPIALTNAFPDPDPPPAATNAPGRGIVQLASFGLGGETPAWLTPRTDAERERGLAHLARELTVPMGTLLIASWMIVVLVALFVAARVCVPKRMRDVVLACAPPIVALCVAFTPGGARELGGVLFDAAWFGPDSARQSGMWESDPEVLRGFGGVVGAAVIALAVLVVVQCVDHVLARRARERT